MKKNIVMRKNAGFTLVEMLVSLAIFIIVTAIVGSIYTTFVQKQRDQLGQQNVQQDVQNFFDTLEREVRTGYGDTFPSATNVSASSLTFKNQEKIDVTYKLDAANKIERNNVVITSGRTYIEKLQFIVPSKSVKSSDGLYLTGMPTRVTVLVRACADKAGNGCFSTQTSLSVRQFTPGS